MKPVRSIVFLVLGVALGAALVISVAQYFSFPPEDTIEHSEDYLDVETTLLIALSDVFGSEVWAGNPYVQSEVQHAQIYQRLYHFESADSGDYIEGSDNFYPWLRDFMGHRVARAAGRADDVQPEFERRLSHAQSQVKTAIYEPNSEIGEIFRRMEKELRAETGRGSDIYWVWLIEPYVHGVYFYSPYPPIGGAVGGIEQNLIDNLQFEYKTARRRGEVSDDLLFADFLAQNEYLPETMSQ